MKMIIQTNNQNQSNQKAWRIKTQVSTILTKWGLLPRFTRWRLARDPSTGMVVLFGVLNSRFIAMHTSSSFNDYFDLRVLHDLADELQVQVISFNNDGLRYAFILERGELSQLSTPINTALVSDHSLVRQGVGDFLKVFDDIQLRDNAASQFSAQKKPAIATIDENEFNRRVAEQQANRQAEI
jgi:hypothetical protein